MTQNKSFIERDEFFILYIAIALLILIIVALCFYWVDLPGQPMIDGIITKRR